MQAIFRFLVLFLASVWVANPAIAQKKKNVEVSNDKMAEYETTFTEGTKYLITDEYAKAIVAFGTVVEKLPDNSGANYAMANALAKNKEYERALPYSEKAYQINNRNEFYALLLADLYANAKRYDAAIKIYKQLVESFPDNTEYHLELAGVLVLQNQYAEALKTYEHLEKRIGISEEITRQKQLLLLREDKIDQALAEGEKLIADDPTEISYLLHQAQLLLSNNRTEQALIVLDKAQKLSPSEGEIQVMLAETYRKQGNIEKCNAALSLAFADPTLEAITKAKILASYLSISNDVSIKNNAFTLVQQLVKMHPQEPHGHLIYGDLLLQQNEKKLARNAYIKAARLDKSVFDVWGRILQLDGDLNQPDSLIQHSDEAIEVFPNQPMFWYSNGSGHYLKHHYDKAADALEEARRLASIESSTKELLLYINAQLGDTYNNLGKHTRSDDAYDAVLQQDSTNDHVLNNYSYFLSLRKEKLPQAIAMAKKLIERNPNDGTYLDTYAWVLYQNGEFEKAKTYLEKAIAHNTRNSGTIVEHYGDVLFKLGDKAHAIDQWKNAKNMGGGSNLLDKKVSTESLHE